jgi:Skp family chaperone for outer membrane proteins
MAGGAGLFVLLLSVWAICAENPPASSDAPAGEFTKVAILDVNKLFKENVSFKKQINDLKKEADALDKQMKDAEKELAEMTTKLAGMSAGSEDYTAMQKKIVSGRTMFTTEVQLQRQEFLKREAEAYYATYSKIEKIVEAYSQEHHIDLVLRFMGDAVDEKNPESILAGINKPVVWHTEDLDITPAVMKVLADQEEE